QTQDTETISITVVNVNREPVLGAIGNKSVDENALLQFSVTATDPDGTTPTLSAQNLPSGATFTAGVFSWTPSFSAAASSPYSVTFVASDGQAQDSETISITVNDVPTQPAMLVVSPNGGETWSHRQYVQIQWSAPQSSGSNVRIELWRNGAMLRTITNSTFNDGALTYRVPPFLPEGGGYRIRIYSATNGAIMDESDGAFSVTS
ncbi:MAG TPA: Ser-Thr-rich GPI-anchored membrane family protein, partial [Candidatus Hydrogenedentes bacterium]|nr:Ser-Thr-rich GPI-anchored membrane family protein [Candidatus Hydrogenedentota bacterium]